MPGCAVLVFKVFVGETGTSLFFPEVTISIIRKADVTFQVHVYTCHKTK